MSKFYLGVIACLVVALLAQWGCNRFAVSKLEKQLAQKPPIPKPGDTTYLHDTVEVPKYIPVPVAVEQTKPTPGNILTPVPCEDLVTYRDTVVFQYGSVILNDEVQGNRIVGRQPVWNIDIPVAIKQEAPKRRNEVFLGLNGSYRTIDSAMSVGPSISLLTKQGTQYEVGVMLDTRGRLTYGAGMKFKLRLRK